MKTNNLSYTAHGFTPRKKTKTQPLHQPLHSAPPLVALTASETTVLDIMTPIAPTPLNCADTAFIVGNLSDYLRNEELDIDDYHGAVIDWD